jgi:hypothetical protein
VWHDSARLVQSSPWLGSGLGTFEDAFRRFKRSAGDHAVQHAESDWVEFGTESGLAGMVLAVAAVGLLFAAGLRAARSSTPLVRGLVAGALAGLVALGVHSAFDFNLHIPAAALMAAALLSVTLSAGTSDSTPAARGRRWLSLPSAIALALALATPASPRPIGPDALIHVSRARALTLRRTSLEAATRSHLDRRPADPVGWLALAWLRAANHTNEAAGLSEWAAKLDPLNRAVQDAKARLTGATSH